jgi:hypothetical protein
VCICQLNIDAETPAELLNQSKEIVVRHKDVQAQMAQLEKEYAHLFDQNQRLVLMCRERDEQLLQSGVLQAQVFDFAHYCKRENSNYLIL